MLSLVKRVFYEKQQQQNLSRYCEVSLASSIPPLDINKSRNIGIALSVISSKGGNSERGQKKNFKEALKFKRKPFQICDNLVVKSYFDLNRNTHVIMYKFGFPIYSKGINKQELFTHESPAMFFKYFCAWKLAEKLFQCNFVVPSPIHYDLHVPDVVQDVHITKLPSRFCDSVVIPDRS